MSDLYFANYVINSEMLEFNIKSDGKATDLKKITIIFDQKSDKKLNKKLGYNRRRNLDPWL